LLWLWEQMTLLVGGIIYNCVKSEKWQVELWLLSGNYFTVS
jgi:hypothetical protein